MSLSEILRVTRLCQLWGMTPAQARIVAELAFGGRPQ